MLDKGFRSILMLYIGGKDEAHFPLIVQSSFSAELAYQHTALKT